MPRVRQIPSFAGPADAPMSELNTTPLIDVMLVLLVMFIITVPISTHKVPLDLPQGPVVERPEPVVYRLELDRVGKLYLNGSPIADAELRGRLERIAAEPASEMHLRADGETPYDRFDRVLAAVKRAGVTRLGMVGNERFAEAVR